MWSENSTSRANALGGQHRSCFTTCLRDTHTHSCTHFTERVPEASKDHLELLMPAELLIPTIAKGHHLVIPGLGCCFKTCANLYKTL